MRVSLLVPAAGKGERLGLDRPKALVKVAGRSLLSWTFFFFPPVDEVLIALPPAVKPPEDLDATFVEGGKNRQESVWRLLERATGDIVLVHDAARPLVNPEVVKAVLEAAQKTGAATPVISVPDTLIEDANGVYGAVLDRERYRLVQTPQGFRRELLQRAHEAARQAGREASDDAQLVTALGRPVALVPGDRRTFKVTYPEDLELFAALVERFAGKFGKGG